MLIHSHDWNMCLTETVRFASDGCVLASLGTLGPLGLLAAGVALGLFAWRQFLNRCKPRAPEPAPQSPQMLFHELCGAHRLSAAQMRLLEWVASDQQLPQPGLLFLDPLPLERALARSENSGVRKRLTDLRAKLFAGLLELAPAAR